MVSEAHPAAIATKTERLTVRRPKLRGRGAKRSSRGRGWRRSARTGLDAQAKQATRPIHQHQHGLRVGDWPKIKPARKENDEDGYKSPPGSPPSQPILINWQ